MISFCIKSLDKGLIDKLESEIDAIEFQNIIYLQKDFSKFHNLIIHYVGYHKNDFYNVLSEILTSFIIKNYEDTIILRQLHIEFFYFSKSEQFDLLNNTKKLLNTNHIALSKKKILKEHILKFILNNRKFNINGIIDFRICNYKNFIYSQLEETIHNYVIEKEYLEYVHLLKDYISVKPSQCKSIHLIHSNSNESTLIDDYGNVITTTDEKKYLSDISFSNNDFILNSILSILPKKLIIHTCSDDNFIQFLQSIFEDRCQLCSGCKICVQYNKKCKKYLN